MIIDLRIGGELLLARKIERAFDETELTRLTEEIAARIKKQWLLQDLIQDTVKGAV